MPEQIPYIRVFLSSPGDVTDERKIALEVMERLPNRPAFRERVAFRIIAWDKPGAGTPMRATLTPQEAINQGLPKPSECDIVIVLFWSRMGTPFVDSDGKTYLSGTHWELLDGLQSERAETVIYRRTEDRLFKSDDREGAEQAERVKTFFRSELFYQDGRIMRGINSYETPDDFRRNFETDFEDLVVKLLKKLEAAPQVAEPQLPALPQIRMAVPKAWPADKSPFPGLTRFTEADAEIFFGRGREIDALVRRVAESRFVAIVGASGSGKSSLVGAGLIPRLRANAISGNNLGSQDWLIARFTPGEGASPFEALGAALIRTIPALAHTNPLIYPKDLERFGNDLKSRADILVTTLDNALKHEKPWTEVLLFIDQFEELFTLAEKEAGKETVQAFTLMLANAAQYQRLRIVVTLRADFYQRAVPYQELAELLREGSFPLAAPKRDALREMIVRPAERANLEFEQGLVERILDETGDDPGNLALLAYLLEKLYFDREKTGLLSKTSYEKLGGVQGAIGQLAEALFTKPGKMFSDETLAVVFRELVDVDERGEATRQRALVSKIVRDEATQQLVKDFTHEKARLLVYDKDVEGQPTIEVAHEALLRQWPRLNDWINKEQTNLRLRRQIGQDAREWDRHQRSSGYLLMGSRLEDALRLQNTFAVDTLETTFIQASLTEEAKRAQKERDDQAERLRLAEENAENAQRAEVAERERAEAQSAKATRARLAAGIAGGLAIIALIGIIVAFFSANEATKRSNQAQNDQGTAVAQAATAVAAQDQAVNQLATAQISSTLSALEGHHLSTLLPGLGQIPPTPSASVMPQDAFATATQIANAYGHEGDVIKTFDDGVEMVQVPAGCFWIGSNNISYAVPIAYICFKDPFWIDRFEVTNEQYQRLTGQAPPSDYTGEKRPVEQIDWFGASDYCEKTRKDARLPTEAEWEYAAVGPDSYPYPWGREFPQTKVEEFGVFYQLETADIGEGLRKSGRSWVGAYDMSGNVWEWVSSLYEDYPYDATDGREADTGNRTDVSRVVRGGSFKSFETNLRGAGRDRNNPFNHINVVGFRCARSSEP